MEPMAACSKAETLVAPRISMVPGVAQVQVNGQQKYAVHVCKMVDGVTVLPGL